MPCNNCNKDKILNERKKVSKITFLAIFFILSILIFFIPQDLQVAGSSLVGVLFYLLVSCIIYITIKYEKYFITTVVSIVGVLGVISIDILY